MTTKDIPTPAERDWWQRGYDAARAEDRRKLAAYDALLAALTMLEAHAELFGAFRDDVGQAVLGEVEAAIALARKEAP